MYAASSHHSFYRTPPIYRTPSHSPTLLGISPHCTRTLFDCLPYVETYTPSSETSSLKAYRGNSSSSSFSVFLSRSRTHCHSREAAACLGCSAAQRYSEAPSCPRSTSAAIPPVLDRDALENASVLDRIPYRRLRTHGIGQEDVVHFASVKIDGVEAFVRAVQHLH